MEAPNKGKEKGYREVAGAVSRVSSAAQLGLIAATSAVLGGLAVAWWHRKTLSQLQNPINTDNLLNPEFSGMEEEDTDTI
jgi:hypothetical protein